MREWENADGPPHDYEPPEDHEPPESDESSTIPKDVWFEQACEEIPKIIAKVKVATDREIKVRLEGEPFPGKPGYFPWLTGYAIKYLVKQEVLQPFGYRGRRKVGQGVPKGFYALWGTPYNEIESLIEIKRRVTTDVNSILTGLAPASFHAENLFIEAFDKLGFEFLGRNLSKLNDEQVKGTPGKPPPNIDFAQKRDGIKHGIDVKNWIRYEIGSRYKIDVKVSAAKQLKTVPFIIARYIDREWTNKIIYEEHGLVFEYKQLLIPPSMRSLAEDARNYLEYPVIATDKLPKEMLDKIEDIHKRYRITNK